MQLSFRFTGDLDCRGHARAVNGFWLPVASRLRVIANLYSSGKKKSAKAHARQLLQWHRAKIWAAGLAIGFDDIDAIHALSREIDCFASDARGTVEWWQEPKRSGRGFRPVCKLPPRLLAEHYLVKLVLEAQLVPNQHLYGIKRRGRDVEAQQIKRAAEEGYRWCSVGDLRDCFQSVDPEALYDTLPLPRNVIGNCLDYRRLTFQQTIENEADTIPFTHRRPNGPRGLIQGSPTSNVALALLLNDLPAAVAPHDCKVFLISDNLFIASRDQETGRMINTLVQEYFSGHRAGPFELHQTHSSAIENGIEHQGYFFQAHETGVSIEPTHVGYENIYRALNEAFAQAEDEGNCRPLFFALHRRLSGYNAWTSRRQFAEAVIHLFPDEALRPAATEFDEC